VLISVHFIIPRLMLVSGSIRGTTDKDKMAEEISGDEEESEDDIVVEDMSAARFEQVCKNEHQALLLVGAVDSSTIPTLSYHLLNSSAVDLLYKVLTLN